MFDQRVNFKRPTLGDYARLGRGVTAKLYDMLYAHGRQGTALFLPFDQLWEHGPVHQMTGLDEGIGDPGRVIKFANEGKFSGIVLQIGLAEKYGQDLRPDLPLILKIDGHINAGKDADMPTHAEFCSLDRAMKAGASAVGMTYYLGSTDTTRDVERIGRMVERAHEYGVPVVLWSYPRGPVVDKTQGDSLYWVHHAVKSAEDFGVDIVKTKPPVPVKKDKLEAYKVWIADVEKKTKGASMYLEYEPVNSTGSTGVLDPDVELTEDQHIDRYSLVIGAAPRTFVIFSGGPKIQGDAKKVLEYQTRVIMEAGGEGAIYGRNLWGVPTEKGLELMEAVHSILAEPQYRRPLPMSMRA